MLTQTTNTVRRLAQRSPCLEAQRPRSKRNKCALILPPREGPLVPLLYHEIRFFCLLDYGIDTLQEVHSYASERGQIYATCALATNKCDSFTNNILARWNGRKRKGTGRIVLHSWKLIRRAPVALPFRGVADLSTQDPFSISIRGALVRSYK